MKKAIKLDRRSHGHGACGAEAGREIGVKEDGERRTDGGRPSHRAGAHGRRPASPPADRRNKPGPPASRPPRSTHPVQRAPPIVPAIGPATRPSDIPLQYFEGRVERRLRRRLLPDRGGTAAVVVGIGCRGNVEQEHAVRVTACRRSGTDPAQGYDVTVLRRTSKKCKHSVVCARNGCAFEAGATSPCWTPRRAGCGCRNECTFGGCVNLPSIPDWLEGNVAYERCRRRSPTRDAQAGFAWPAMPAPAADLSSSVAGDHGAESPSDAAACAGPCGSTRPDVVNLN
jgi:hypothetical protein